MIIVKSVKNAIELLLSKGVERVYPSKEALAKKLIGKKKIRVYCGYDPSGSSLHLGHLITLRKLSEFQKLGHEVIMLIGDFTGMIGDPTDKMATRKKLTRKEALENCRGYKKQASRFLDFEGKNKAKILYNSGWQDKLSFPEIIELASNFTVQQMIARDMFQKRLEQKKPIYLHEFLYPLVQAYDSAAMAVDLEIGGNDQTFNMLCGRDLMAATSGKEKFVMALKLLTAESGEKMGKTENNMIALSESAREIYGKIMSWPDGLIIPAMELLTDIGIGKIKIIGEKMAKDEINPKDAKSILAKAVVSLCCSSGEAIEAAKEFKEIFSLGKLPKDPQTAIIKKEKLTIQELLAEAGLAGSKAEAKRLIVQKSIRIDGVLETDWRKELKIKSGQIIQAGKHRFKKLLVKN